MEAKNKKRNYIEWFTPDELHEQSKLWSSELKFAMDEQRFLNDLVKEHTLELIDKAVFEKVNLLLTELIKIEAELVKVYKRVQLHENQLQIMVDDVDQIKMENAYMETHKDLSDEVKDYFERYRDIKTRLFKVVIAVMKKSKQKRLLN